MRAATYPGARAFLERAQEYLEQEEGLNNLLLGICLRLNPTDPSALLVGVEEGGELALAGAMTPPHQLILYSHLSNPEEAAAALAQHLCCSPFQVPGVLAAAPLARVFARAWQASTGRDFTAGMRQCVYQLRQVRSRGAAPGNLRPACREDLEMLSEWAMGFNRDVWKRPPAENEAAEARRLVEGKIAQQDLYVWEDHDQPLSMAGRARPTRRTIAVNLVYTPPALRGKGYATSCVASLSQVLLDSGFACCTLFADLENPTSNRIYQQIGYEPVADFEECLFASA